MGKGAQRSGTHLQGAGQLRVCPPLGRHRWREAPALACGQRRRRRAGSGHRPEPETGSEETSGAEGGFQPAFPPSSPRRPETPPRGAQAGSEEGEGFARAGASRRMGSEQQAARDRSLAGRGVRMQKLVLSAVVWEGRVVRGGMGGTGYWGDTAHCISHLILLTVPCTAKMAAGIRRMGLQPPAASRYGKAGRQIVSAVPVRVSGCRQILISISILISI